MQSDGEPASEVVMRMVQIERCHDGTFHRVRSSNSNRRDTATRATEGQNGWCQTTRNQIKAYKIQIEKNSGITITADSPLLTWLPRHAAWQYTRIPTKNKTQRQQHTRRFDNMSYQSPILLVGEAVGVQTTRSIGQQTGIRHGSKAFGSDVTEK